MKVSTAERRLVLQKQLDEADAVVKALEDIWELQDIVGSLCDRNFMTASRDGFGRAGLAKEAIPFFAAADRMAKEWGTLLKLIARTGKKAGGTCDKLSKKLEEL